VTGGTVSYIKPRKQERGGDSTLSKNTTAGEKKFSKEASKAEQTEDKSAAGSDIDVKSREEAEKAKRWGLEIGPPSSTEVPKEMTNVSPKKTGKIAANVPLDEKQSGIVAKAETPAPAAVKEFPKTTPNNADVQYCIQ